MSVIEKKQTYWERRARKAEKRVSELDNALREVLDPASDMDEAYKLAWSVLHDEEVK